MPRKRRPDQGPPVPRCKKACIRCRKKRLKCAGHTRPCQSCQQADAECVDEEESPRGTDNHLRDRFVIVTFDDDDDAVSASEQRVLDEIEAEDDNNEVFDELTVLPSSTLSWTPAVPTTSALLESVPFFKVLWHHYIDVLACLHSSHERQKNPIVKVLGPVAQSNDALLAVLLAASLENYKSLRGERPDQGLLTSLLNTAIHGITKALAEAHEGRVSDEIIAAVVALCDFEVVARKRATTSSWKVHFQGAKKLIELRGGPNAMSHTPSLYRFLVKWLAYFDVMASITPTAEVVPLFDGIYWRSESIDDEFDFNLDPYMSFLQDVMPMFFEIGALTQRKKLLDATISIDLRKALDLLNCCRSLEARLRMTLGKVSGQAYIGAQKSRIMINCHDSFVQASLIHLFRRVEGLSSHAECVRAAFASGLCNIADSCLLDGEDFIDSSLLFPLFTFGCEATTSEERDYLMNRLISLQALGLGNVDRAIEVLQTVWTREIPAYGPDWDEILGMFDWEVNLA